MTYQPCTWSSPGHLDSFSLHARELLLLAVRYPSAAPLVRALPLTFGRRFTVLPFKSVSHWLFFLHIPVNIFSNLPD